MGFLDFLKKNRPAPAPVIEAPAPIQPSSGSEVFSDGPPAPDSFLNQLTQEHDPADDLFSPTPASIPKPAMPASIVPASHDLPNELFAAPKEDHADWSPKPAQPAVPVAPSMPARGAAAEIPDFSEEDIAAIEELERASTLPHPNVPVAPISPIGMDLPSVASKPVEHESNSISEFLLPPAPRYSEPEQAHPLPSFPQEPVQSAPETEDGFMSAEDYLTITDGIRASRKSLRKCDDAIRDALGRHEAVDAQYARAAADIASVEQRLRALDASLFGE